MRVRATSPRNGRRPAVRPATSASDGRTNETTRRDPRSRLSTRTSAAFRPFGGAACYAEGSRPAKAARRSYGNASSATDTAGAKTSATVRIGQPLLHEGQAGLGDLVVQPGVAAERVRQVPGVHGDLRDLPPAPSASSDGCSCQWWIRSSAPDRKVVAHVPSAICPTGADQSTSSPRAICRKRGGPDARCNARSRTVSTPHGGWLVQVIGVHGGEDIAGLVERAGQGHDRLGHSFTLGPLAANHNGSARREVGQLRAHRELGRAPRGPGRHRRTPLPRRVGEGRPLRTAWPRRRGPGRGEYADARCSPSAPSASSITGPWPGQMDVMPCDEHSACSRSRDER